MFMPKLVHLEVSEVWSTRCRFPRGMSDASQLQPHKDVSSLAVHHPTAISNCVSAPNFENMPLATTAAHLNLQQHLFCPSLFDKLCFDDSLLDSSQT